MSPRNIKNFKPSAKSRFKQGEFDKYNPGKYYGERPIIYRSSWELKFMRICEFNPAVEKWTSENIVIPYTMKEFIGGKFVIKRHNYYPDFVVHLKNGDKILVEIKPLSQSPMNENQMKLDPIQYKNARKWKAALEWSKQNGYQFKVITEQHLQTKIF